MQFIAGMAGGVIDLFSILGEHETPFRVFVYVSQVESLFAIDIFQVKDISGAFYVLCSIFKRDAERSGCNGYVPIHKDTEGGTFGNSLLVAIEL